MLEQVQQETTPLGDDEFRAWQQQYWPEVSHVNAGHSAWMSARYSLRHKDDWFDATKNLPKHLEVVLTENDGYYEVCVYRDGFNGPSSFMTHNGMLVVPSYWRKLPRREQE